MIDGFEFGTEYTRPDDRGPDWYNIALGRVRRHVTGSIRIRLRLDRPEDPAPQGFLAHVKRGRKEGDAGSVVLDHPGGRREPIPCEQVLGFTLLGPHDR